MNLPLPTRPPDIDNARDRAGAGPARDRGGWRALVPAGWAAGTPAASALRTD